MKSSGSNLLRFAFALILLALGIQLLLEILLQFKLAVLSMLLIWGGVWLYKYLKGKDGYKDDLSLW